MNEKRLNQQLRTFEKILEAYKLDEPLARFLAGYYKQNKQMGSNDRRIASRLLYNYFRLGNSIQDRSFLSRLAVAELLCTTSSDFVTLFDPKLTPYLLEDLEAKVTYLEKEYEFSIESIFPLFNEISDKIKIDEFLISHFKQPNLFIRIHTGEENRVKAALKENEIAFEELALNTLSLANGSQLDKVKSIQGKYEVQDLNSQKTGEFFKPKVNDDWWDVCAASGGKSILLKQLQPTINLLVSDNRNSILRNLDSRFASSGIKEYRRKIIDLTKDTQSVLGQESFDGIIVDAPCSGSGTWGRTPEGMTSFSAEKLQYYISLQKQILENVIKHIKPGKPLIYITCSVYKQENEDQVEFLKTKGFSLEEMAYLEGAEHRADTLFAARLIAG